MTFSRMTIECKYANGYHPTVFLFSSYPFLCGSLLPFSVGYETDNSSSSLVLYKAEHIVSLIPDCNS